MRLCVLTVLTMLALTGCAVPRQGDTPPLHVSLLPNDCANRQVMLDWLDGQARQPRRAGENDREYARSRNDIRRKIWDIRYNCQPV